MTEKTTRRHLVLLVDWADPSKKAWGDFTKEEQAVVIRQHEDFDRAGAASENVRIVAADELEDPAGSFVLSFPEGRPVITEGCHAEATEQIGGYYLMEAPSVEALVELLAIMSTYVMEIRPVAQA